VQIAINAEVRRRKRAHGAPCEFDALLALQHSPVVTLGASSSREHLCFALEDPPLPVALSERGGEPTYHGPGQLVLYPIVDLDASPHSRDLHLHQFFLEQLVIDTLQTLGIQPADRKPGTLSSLSFFHSLTHSRRCMLRLQALPVSGCMTTKLLLLVSVPTSALVPFAHFASFLSPQQCALTHTVPLCRWVTYHGVAINVSPNLSHFDYIVPCGISHLPVGSIEQLASDGFCAPHLASLSASALMERVFALVLEAFERNFGVTIERAGVEDLVNGNEDSIVHWCT